MLMSELGAQATPAIFYLDDNGRLQQHQAPRPDALDTIMGPLTRRWDAWKNAARVFHPAVGNRDWVDGQSHPPSRRLASTHQSAPNTFFARLVAAAAGFLRMLASCSAITVNRPLSACSVT